MKNIGTNAALLCALRYSSHRGDRKAMGQFHTPVGEPVHLETGDFTLDATITPQPAKQ